MKSEDLTGENKRTLQKLRTKMAEKGNECTPDQVLESMETVDRLAKKVGIDGGMPAVVATMSFFSKVPPRPARTNPPYPQFFDDLHEAQEFAARVEEHYQRKLRVIKLDHKQYQLVNE